MLGEIQVKFATKKLAWFGDMASVTVLPGHA